MRRALYILFIVLAVAGTGCGSKKGGSKGGGSPASGFPPVTDPIPPSTTGGSTVNLTIDGKSVMDDYMGWSSCDPAEVKAKIDLRHVADYAAGNRGFGGTISISFKDKRTTCGGTTDNTYTDSFSSMLISSDYNTKKSNAENHVYNLISYNYPGLNGNIGYKGFFEDTRAPRLQPPYPNNPIFGGAIILVIDSTNDLNDGSGPTSANGSIWYKNYTAQYPMGPLPNTNCWFISSGPYDCRSWPSGSNVNTWQSMTPNSGYQRLGTFIGLEIKKAFNNQI